MSDNRLVQALSRMKADGQKALLPFITAGYPDLDTTEALLAEFQKRGVKVCELGIPFSDPVADGPVIQASYTDALAKGITSDGIFETVRRYRESSKPAGNGQLAIVAMVSYSIVFRCGVERYFKSAAAAGFDGLIIPDLPIEESAQAAELARKHNLAMVLLIAPTTPPQRRLEIARASRGFIYYISVSGITGERDKLPQATIDGVAELRKQIDTPVCVGFGIARPQTVREVCKVADGAIVGSAIVHRITDAAAKGLPRERLVEQVGSFVGELMEGLK